MVEIAIFFKLKCTSTYLSRIRICTGFFDISGPVSGKNETESATLVLKC